MAVGLDEITRCHEVAMAACGDNATRLGADAAARLKRLLQLAAMRDADGALVTVAATVVALVRSQAYETGNLRTALVLAAVMLQRYGLQPPRDWVEVAEALAGMSYGNPQTAVQAVAALLAPEPR